VSHAEHFLSRLDRFASRDIDVALELYRDPDLLRQILGAVSLPDQAERVALSLDDPVLGPFIIVTRDGHFVTCLGKGMKAGAHPVVTRGQLDGLSRKFEVLRERLALAMRTTGNKERACARLLRRVLGFPDRVHRDDFLAVSAWEPMLGPVFMDLYMGMSAELLERGPILRSLRHSDGNVERAMHQYWDLLHAAGHLALLATMGGDREHYAQFTMNRPAARSTFSWGLSSTGISTFILRGAWAAGRMGKLLLPAYKKALSEDGALFELFDTIFSLIAVARRTSGLRAEIAGALRAAPRTATTPGAQQLRKGLERGVTVVCEAAAECVEMSDDDAEAALLHAGEHILSSATEEIPDDIRTDLIRLLPLNTYSNGITDGKKVLASMYLIAGAARGAPEQFYFPPDLMDVHHEPWKPEHTRHVLEPIRMAEHASRPVAPPRRGPGPNEPCTCGSGRKFKKCCGKPGAPTEPLKG
jgi:hypothetical protein